MLTSCFGEGADKLLINYNVLCVRWNVGKCKYGQNIHTPFNIKSSFVRETRLRSKYSKLPSYTLINLIWKKNTNFFLHKLMTTLHPFTFHFYELQNTFWNWICFTWIKFYVFADFVVVVAVGVSHQTARICNRNGKHRLLYGRNAIREKWLLTYAISVNWFISPLVSPVFILPSNSVIFGCRCDAAIVDCYERDFSFIDAKILKRKSQLLGHLELQIEWGPGGLLFSWHVKEKSKTSGRFETTSHLTFFSKGVMLPSLRL